MSPVGFLQRQFFIWIFYHFMRTLRIEAGSMTSFRALRAMPDAPKSAMPNGAPPAYDGILARREGFDEPDALSMLRSQLRRNQTSSWARGCARLECGEQHAKHDQCSDRKH